MFQQWVAAYLKLPLKAEVLCIGMESGTTLERTAYLQVGCFQFSFSNKYLGFCLAITLYTRPAKWISLLASIFRTLFIKIWGHMISPWHNKTETSTRIL